MTLDWSPSDPNEGILSLEQADIVYGTLAGEHPDMVLDRIVPVIPTYEKIVPLGSNGEPTGEVLYTDDATETKVSYENFTPIDPENGIFEAVNISTGVKARIYGMTPEAAGARVKVAAQYGIEGKMSCWYGGSLIKPGIRELLTGSGSSGFGKRILDTTVIAAPDFGNYKKGADPRMQHCADQIGSMTYRGMF